MFRCSSRLEPVTPWVPRQLRQCIPGHIEGCSLCSLQKVVQNLHKPPVNFEKLFNTQGFHRCTGCGNDIQNHLAKILRPLSLDSETRAVPTKRCLKQRLTRNDYSRVSTTWVKHLPFPDGYWGANPRGTAEHLAKKWDPRCYKMAKNGMISYDFPLLCRDSKTQLMPAGHNWHRCISGVNVLPLCSTCEPRVRKKNLGDRKPLGMSPSCWATGAI